MKPATGGGWVCASIMVAGATLLPMIGEARAQTVFTTIQAFGDSYADIGNAFRLAGVPNPAA
jgi:outer membrane lipase/esterase